MRDRLRGDFQMASMLLFWAVSCLIILAFGVYRTWRGDFGIALMDLVIVIALSLPIAYAWRTRRYTGAVLAILAVTLIGGIGVTQVLGRAGLMWSYPVLLVSFFIAPRRPALVTNTLLIIGVALLGRGFVGEFERFSYLATAGLATLLAFIFAQRTARQREQLELLASFDALTAAGNRRLMEQDLAHAVSARGLKRGRPGLAVMDLDHFKRINDQHGHEAGDRVLVAFADLVRGCVRKPDRFYRLGGEEFVLLVPATTAAGLAASVGKVRERVAAQLRASGDAVTVSIGAALHEPGEAWPAWLARADAALYQAKREGRDRVVMAAQDGAVLPIRDERRQAQA